MARKYKNSGIEWIGRIPKEWKTARLKYIGNYINGYAFKPEDWSNKGMPIIRIQDLTGSFANPNYYNGSIDKKYVIKSGDILVSWAATLDAFIWQKEDGLLNQHIFKAYPVANVDRMFFYWLIKVAMENMNNDNKHGIVMQHVTTGVFGNFTVPLPSYSEQQRIADYLDEKCGEIDSLISLQEQMIAQLKDYKQSVISEAVTKGLDPNAQLVSSGIDWIGDIPKGWKVARIKNVASLYGRIGFRGYTSDDLNKDGVGAITLSPSNMLSMKMDYTNVTYLSWEKYYESPEIMIQNGDLLMVKTGSSYGKVSYVDNLPREATINPQILRIIPKIKSKYLGYYLQTQLFLYHVEGGVVGGTIPTIAQEKINNFKVILPSLDEQRAIAEYLDNKCAEIDALIALKHQKIETLKDYKKSLIYEAVTGKMEIV